MAKTSVNKVLQKISDGKLLSKADKKALAELISVLRKAKKGKDLSQSNRQLIDDTIHKARTGSITAADLINLAGHLFHLFEFFKDTT